MENNVTELVFILDKSGSMAGLEKDTIGGFNAMIEKQKAAGGKVYVSNVMDRAADGVKKRGTTAYPIIATAHLLDFINIHTVMNYLTFVIKQDCGNVNRSLFLPLTLNHRIKSADSVRLKARHRSAPIKNKYKLRYVVFHNNFSLKKYSCKPSPATILYRVVIYFWSINNLPIHPNKLDRI